MCSGCDREDKVVIYGAVLDEQKCVSIEKRDDTSEMLYSTMMGFITHRGKGRLMHTHTHTHTLKKTAFYPVTMPFGLTCHRLLMTVNVHRFVILCLCVACTH